MTTRDHSDKPPPQMTPAPQTTPHPSRTPADSAEIADLEIMTRAKTLNQAYGNDALSQDWDRDLLSLERLPSWPGGPDDTGCGWGRPLDQALGGGLYPGYLLGVSGEPGNTIKTSWLGQLADGLALRTIETLANKTRAPLTPVVLVSELSPAEITWHSVARWTGVDARVVRAGVGAHRLDVVHQMARDQRTSVDQIITGAQQQCKRALYGPLGEARLYIRCLQPRQSAGPFAARLTHLLDVWHRELTRQLSREVWPVVIVDPVRHWEPGTPFDEALYRIAERMSRLARTRGWIVLLAIPAPNVGPPFDNGLLHLVDAAIDLRTAESDPLTFEAAVIANRWGAVRPPHPRFRWARSLYRFKPLPPTRDVDAQSAE